MKRNERNGTPGGLGIGATIRESCASSCQNILAQVREVKAAIFTEASRVRETPERWLRLALNEAEALAWETRYPHLVFPTLAAEKVQALTGWANRQQSLRRTAPPVRLAA